jgi:hypothetical protein
MVRKFYYIVNISTAKSVYYSQYVQWHNPLHKNRSERALLVLTRSLLYIAEPNTFTPLDAVKVMDIHHIVQSGYEHDIITIVPEQHVLEYNNDGLEGYDIMIRFEQQKSEKTQDSTPDELSPYDRKIQFFDQITGIYSKLKINVILFYSKLTFSLWTMLNSSLEWEQTQRKRNNSRVLPLCDQ